jgi:ankyrin repeat protein
MKHLKLFENFDSYDPYELMIVPPNKKAEMIMREIKKSNPNLNLVNDLIVLGANLDWQNDHNDILLFTPVRHKNADALRLLLESGADPNLQNDYGISALHIASVKNVYSGAKILLEFNANPNIQSEMKKTPLHIASYFNNLTIVNILLQSGADPNLKDINGKTPLDLVGQSAMIHTYKDESIIEILKEYMGIQ